MKTLQRLIWLICIYLLFILLYTNGLDAQQVEWAEQLGNIRLDEGTAIAISSSSNIYATGSIIDTSVIEGDTLLSANALTARLNSTGNILWQRQFGGKTQDIATGVGVDNNDNCYVVGAFSDSLNINGTAIKAWNGFDFALWKYDENGTIVWIRSLASRGDVKNARIVTDEQGNSYITATFLDSLAIGNDTIVPKGGVDILLAKYAANGTLQWWKTFGDHRPEQVQKIGLSSSGQLYLTGFFAQTTTFGDQILQAAGGTDAFLTQLDTDGKVLWAKRFGGLQNDSSNDLFVTANGEVYFTGQYTGNVLFEDQELIGANYAQIFVAQYNTMGQLQFVHAINSTNHASGTGIVVDEQTGDYWITGAYDNTLQFNPETQLSSLIERFFVAQFSAAQQLRGATQSGGTDLSFSNAMAIDQTGNAYVIGGFTGFLSFDNQVLSATGNFDISLVKLNPLSLTTDIPSGFSTSPILMTVYPNPSSHYLNISWEFMPLTTDAPTHIQLINAFGQVVWQENNMHTPQRKAYQLDLDAFSVGWYLVRLQIGHQVQKQAVQIMR